MKRFAILLTIPVLTLLAAACDGGDDEGDETPTNVPTLVAPTEEGESPTPGTTGTVEPGETDTPDATASPEATATPEATFEGSTDPENFDAEGQPSEGNYTLTDVRVGEHDEAGGFDRIVFEFEDDDGHPGGRVEYVDEVSQCGSGNPVEVGGDSILSVRFDMAQAHNEQGELTIDDTEVDGPGNSILEAVSYCDFEGIVEWAIGVPSELDFRVRFLEDTSRVVIDIQHP